VSECIQALGRGSRKLDLIAEGTLICDSPIETVPESYLKVLEAKDNETAYEMETHMKVAKLVHNKVIENKEENK
jgi:hypothetical protein